MSIAHRLIAPARDHHHSCCSQEKDRTLKTMGFKKLDENRQLFLIIRQISRVVVVVAASVYVIMIIISTKNVVFSDPLIVCFSSLPGQTWRREAHDRVYVSDSLNHQQFSLFTSSFFLTDMGSNKVWSCSSFFVVVCMPLVRFLYNHAMIMRPAIRNGE